MVDIAYPDWPAADLDGERRAIRADLGALSLRASKAGLTSVSQVIDLLIAQCMDSAWPKEPEE